MLSPKNRAIGKAARTKAIINALERVIDEGIEDAQGEGLPGVLDKLIIAKAAVATAHHKLGDVATALSAAFNEDPQAFSGGSADDKEPPPEGNP